MVIRKQAGIGIVMSDKIDFQLKLFSTEKKASSF